MFLNQNEEEDIFKSKSAQYKDQVFDILNNGKARLPLSDDELYNIQMGIEDLTMTFDEESMFHSKHNKKNESVMIWNVQRIISGMQN